MPSWTATKVQIRNRWTGSVQYEASIDCPDDTPWPVELGLAVKSALKHGADLTGADLTGADLRHAYLTGADLRHADLRHAVLTGADLTGADLTGVPVIPHIDAAILAAVEAPGNRLDMSSWHTCETTHCRAGWAITLAGDAGAALEREFGSAAAGALIYAASRPGQPIPDFYASNDDALADLRACAAQQTEGSR